MGGGTLSEFTETLLRNPDRLSNWLSIADKHMQTLAQNPDLFTLPKAHEFMRPLIESFHKDTEGFTFYLIELRDKFDRNSSQFVEVQKVYRRINGRHVQASRRERIRRAVAKAEEIWGEIPYTVRMQWMARLEHEWAQRRLVFLDQARRRLKTERMSTEQRTEVLLEFWDMIDTEIYEGNIPSWN